ncbi:hypothetical protein DE4585_01460 [Mycobacteroides salmoniphilum]|uniref:Uncharacterized protein n=1 Tax=Mycobacteroides salmoniphilum TaxID=404941 RepID=A0A4V3HYQ8_9MYCO|nr:hypothetical protein DE4585_01460 [Mycobacteroides salmoniphilum]
MWIQAQSDRAFLVNTPTLRDHCPNGSTRAAGDVSVRQRARGEKRNLCG